MYYDHVAGDKYERDHTDRQLSDDKAAQSVHYQRPAGIQDCCAVCFSSRAVTVPLFPFPVGFWLKTTVSVFNSFGFFIQKNVCRTTHNVR